MQNNNTLQLDTERMTPDEFYSYVESKINFELVLANTKNYRREEPIGPYFADFFFPNNNLVLEIDGVHHKGEEQANHDRIRDAYMNAAGYCVVRVTGSIASRNPSGVLSAIRYLKGVQTYFINDDDDIKVLILKSVEVETERCSACNGKGVVPIK